jgi:hypothetical protein
MPVETDRVHMKSVTHVYAQSVTNLVAPRRGVRFCAASSSPALSSIGGEGEATATFAAPALNSMAVEGRGEGEPIVRRLTFLLSTIAHRISAAAYLVPNYPKNLLQAAPAAWFAWIQ